MYRKYVNMKGIIEMDKLINWLFQSTQDGSTYLQVIIITLLLFLMIHIFFTDISKTLKQIREEDEK